MIIKCGIICYHVKYVVLIEFCFADFCWKRQQVIKSICFLVISKYTTYYMKSVFEPKGPYCWPLTLVSVSWTSSQKKYFYSPWMSPQHLFCWCQHVFIHLAMGCERNCESAVSCRRTHQQGSNLDCLLMTYCSPLGMLYYM